jgi:hypothetical protein
MKKNNKKTLTGAERNALIVFIANILDTTQDEAIKILLEAFFPHISGKETYEAFKARGRKPKFRKKIEVEISENAVSILNFEINKVEKEPEKFPIDREHFESILSLYEKIRRAPAS